MEAVIRKIRIVALAHDTRVDIFRLLLKERGIGLTSGEIGKLCNIKPSSLTAHLKLLCDAGLVARKQRGRELFHKAIPAALDELIGSLVELSKATEVDDGLSLVSVAQGSPESLGLRATLRKNNLPADDLGGDGQRYFALVDKGGTEFGYGGLEGAGADQLIRSLIIHPPMRGKGAGRALVRLLEAQARQEGAQRLWLLTEDAERFFARLRYKTVARDQAPKAITRTKQFTKLCPASAKLMVREVKG